MPRSKKMDEHLVELQEALESGDYGANYPWQYPTRVGTELALKFVTECIENGEQPAEGVRRILTQYYQTKDSPFGWLSSHPQRILRAICSLTKQSPGEVLNQLITEFGMQKLEQIKSLLPPSAPPKQLNGKQPT